MAVPSTKVSIICKFLLFCKAGGKHMLAVAEVMLHQFLEIFVLVDLAWFNLIFTKTNRTTGGSNHTPYGYHIQCVND